METVHVVAINPYRKGNKGKVFSYNIDTYDKVIGSEEIKKMIQQIRGELCRKAFSSRRLSMWMIRSMWRGRLRRRAS